MLCPCQLPISSFYTREIALYFFSTLQKMADPPEYFYHTSNRKEMSHAKILLLNTFKFCEQPLILLGKISICIVIFREPHNVLGNYRSSCAACCATQQFKPNQTFSVLLFHHLLPVWDTNKVGGQRIKSELMVWADILPSSNNSSLKLKKRSKENYSLSRTESLSRTDCGWSLRAGHSSLGQLTLT